MAVRKPTPRALAARRETRMALMEALRDIRAAKKSILRTGSLKAYVTPTVFPPMPTGGVCKTITTDSIVLNPPYVPYFRCRIAFPPRVPLKICGISPKEIGITRKDFEKAFDAIDLWVRYLLKIYDAVYPKRPARPKPRARR